MFFSLFKKKKEILNVESLKVDLHSHLIPGIDDGSQSMEESLALLKDIEKIGYEKVITTPHIMLDSYRNTPEIINDGLSALREAAKEEGITLDIEAAAEYYLDDGFYDLLKKGNILTIANEYLLFETSYVSKPLQFEEMIFEISSAGYKPMMAHPERYRYVKDPEKEYGRWRDLGVFLQVNINSFGGHYGKSAQDNAKFLSQAGWIDFLGSDTHHAKHVDSLGKVINSEIYVDIFTNNTILNDSLH